jgi:hypothetical protein
MPNEPTDGLSERERFKRAANTRAGNAIVHLRRIGRLANSSDGRYDYTQKDVDRIIEALSGEIEKLRVELESGITARRAKVVRPKPERPTIL